MIGRILTAAALAAGLAIGGAALAAPGCDEACLKAAADQYLDALGARDPKRLKTAAKVRFTENTRPLELGDGLWGTVTGIGPYRHYLTDPARGEVALFGNVEEQGVPALISLRLKVDGAGAISEAETLVIRKEDMGSFLRTDRTLRPLWHEEVPPGQRLSRAELVRISDLYFEALEQDSGKVAPFHPDCVRFENGTQTVNNKAAAGQPSAFAQGFNPMAMTCEEQIDTRLFSYITSIGQRRYAVVDEARQKVFAMAMFHHDGRVTEVDVPGRGKQKMVAAALRPFDVVIAEAFRIKDGKIVEVEAVMTSLPYGSDTGWD